MARRFYDLVVLCDPDVEFEQDGTRRDVAFRLRQQELTTKLLEENGVPFIAVHGDLDARLELVMARLDASGEEAGP